MPTELHTAWKSAAGADGVTMRHQLIKWVERYLTVRKLGRTRDRKVRLDSG